MARRSFQRQRSVARPNRAWSGTTEAAFTTVPAASKVLLSTFTPAAAAIDLTILRVVGGVSVASDQAAANEEQIGAVGLIIVTDQAATAGIASIPGPFTDIGDDWFMYQTFAQRGAVPATSYSGAVWYPIDSKAKRILNGTGSQIAVVAENGQATHGLQLCWQIRILDQVRGTR